MRLVLRERGADHAWITSGDDAIRAESELSLCASDGRIFFSGLGDSSDPMRR